MEFKEGLIRAIETMASFVIIVIMALFAFVTVWPHIYDVPKDNVQLIGQQAATLQNVVLIIIAFFFGQNSGNLRKDQAINKLADQVSAGTTTTSASITTTTKDASNETTG